MTTQAEIDAAAAARATAIEELLTAFETAVAAGRQFDEIARAEGIQTPAWAAANNPFPPLFQALDAYFPFVLEKVPPVREYRIVTPNGGVKVERYAR